MVTSVQTHGGRVLDADTSSSQNPDRSGGDPAALTPIDKLLSRASRELVRFETKPPLGFTFKWQDCPFSARVGMVGGTTRLVVRGEVGVIPYSAEDRRTRDHLFALVGSHSDSAQTTFRVSEDQRLLLVGETPVAHPLTPASIIGLTSQLLLRLKPYLDYVLPLCRELDGDAGHLSTGTPAVTAPEEFRNAS